MIAISLWQPWASLLVAGEKKIETRHWKLYQKMPKVLAIHAAKKWGPDLRSMSHGEPFRPALMRCGFAQDGMLALDRLLPFGAIVGIVRVTDCFPTVSIFKDPGLRESYMRGEHRLTVGSQEAAFGDYSPERFAWVCDRFFALREPIPCRGRQSLFQWEPPADLELPEWAKVTP